MFILPVHKYKKEEKKYTAKEEKRFEEFKLSLSEEDAKHVDKKSFIEDGEEVYPSYYIFKEQYATSFDNETKRMQIGVR